MQYYTLVVFILLRGHLTSSDGDNNLKAKTNILSPAFDDKPFAVVWNVNASECSDYGVQIAEILDEFGIIHNEDAALNASDRILLLYEKSFKYFPMFDRKTGSPINGGLPQNGNLTLLLEEYSSILDQLPPNFHGLGVIDWESWRALFNRMNDTLFVKYRHETIKSIQRRFPHWTEDQRLKYAKFEYDSATQNYMKSVLEVGKILQPQGYWGFYLYPDCRYYNATANDYSCTKEEKRRNDEIQWLFDSSTVLFPSVYIHDNVEDKPYAAQYVANRIREALRVDGNRPGDTSIPVFSYHILNYPRRDDFMDLIDLKNSIGVASLLGGSGAILWGGSRSSESLDECQKLRDYLKTTLGPFCKMASDVTLKCSRDHCNGRGRCVVVKHDKIAGDRYLYPVESIAMAKQFVSDAYALYDVLLSSTQDVDHSRHMIKCQCYTGWKGRHCQL